MAMNEADQPGPATAGLGSGGEQIADQTAGGRAGVVPPEAVQGRQPARTGQGPVPSSDHDRSDGGHLGAAGDPAEGRSDVSPDDNAGSDVPKTG